MRLKDKCAFNEEVKNRIFCLYRESNLAVLEYLVEITHTWGNEAKDFLERYLREEITIDEQDTDMINIFWEAMEYYGLTDYINEREKRLNDVFHDKTGGK